MIVNNIDFLIFLLQLGECLLLVSGLGLGFEDVLILELGHTSISVLGIVGVGLGVDLELMESASQLVVILLQLISFPLTLADVHEEVGVGLLSGEELLDHLLDISDTSGCLDSLEGLINLSRVSHLLLHLLSHKGVPQLLDIEVISHLELG